MNLFSTTRRTTPITTHASKQAKRSGLAKLAAYALLPAALVATLTATTARADDSGTGGTGTSTGTNSPTAAMFTTANAWLPTAPAYSPGWKADFIDNFDTLNTSVWGRYQGGAPAGSHAAYSLNNAQVATSPLAAGGGLMQLTTKYDPANGWTAGGMSSGRGFAATQGKWVIKAKFDRAYGVGYAFLLYPKGGAWPPEVDLAEGTAGNSTIMSTLHYGTAQQNYQLQRFLHNTDMTKWHTYGVIITDTQIQYTLDGNVWATVVTDQTPKVPMWLGIQAGVKDCATSTGECLSDATPLSSTINIDWIAHYQKA